LLEEYATANTVSISQFYIRRFLRLAPALIFMIAIVSATFFALNGFVVPSEIGAGLFYFMNYYLIIEGRTQMPLDPLWSLAVEEHYYIVFPVLLALYGKYRKRLLLFLISLCVAVLVWRIILVTSLHAPMNRTYLSTDTRLDSILFGAVLAVILETEWRDRVRTILINKFVVTSAILLLLSSFLYRDPAFRETVRYSLQGIALLSIFYCSLFASYFSLIRKALESSFAIWIGKLSYAIYLWHAAVQFFVSKALANESLVTIGLIELALSIAMAAVSYYFVEIHFQKLRARFRMSAPVQPFGIGSTPIA
jgi:peptidoglycan/LPS O-acetylase OafA/YrhL